MTKTQLHQLWQLAHYYGVQVTHVDGLRKKRTAHPETCLEVLRRLGAPVHTVSDISPALRRTRVTLWQQYAPPAVVVWDKRGTHIPLRLPSNRYKDGVECSLQLESGPTHDWNAPQDELPVVQSAQIDSRDYVVRKLTLPAGVPYGYHKLNLRIGSRKTEILVVSAPRRAFSPVGWQENRSWGVFLPLYSLHSKTSWGGGDFSDLKRLAHWVRSLGGDFVATTPLTAAFLDRPFEPSPYSPASRQFWNEFYLDVSEVPSLSECPQATALLRSAEVQVELKRLRSSGLANYQEQMKLKRRVLEKLAEGFLSKETSLKSEFQQFVEANPRLSDYASFRATMEKEGRPWPEWSQKMRNGHLTSEDYPSKTRFYYMYVQWLADRQIRSLTSNGKKSNQFLYQDFPLGVHPYSYDVWREKDLFVNGVKVGAPPDAFFASGQNWEFPPFHPQQIRSKRYSYLRACLRHVMQYSAILRIDHILGLHRLFWIPPGMEPEEGVYVKYPAEELYAVLSLESHRHQVVLVGEDLGTVAGYVRSSMASHNILRMFIGAGEAVLESTARKTSVPENSVASLSTHDMPTFAAFWKGLDITDRQKRGILDSKAAKSETKRRIRMKRGLIRTLMQAGWLTGKPTLWAVLQAFQRFLSFSRARALLINLEDLWLETKPQNVPGTGKERPNWQRKARYGLETFTKMSRVVEMLQELDTIIKRKKRR
ncbi:MAG: 4-alpha-glucanotransferase [candidate division Zixibacteria bacterium RBG_16_50_21]|nr:MAG: 4-alpha-glucanotransferase [candidate division Zixibacteria bacterium RBG_16_50_21]